MGLSGLNDYEFKAYQALVANGSSSALQVSRDSKVPHGRIYPVLESLSDKGFVNIHNDSPKRFTAVDPVVVEKNLIDKKEKEFERGKKEMHSEFDKMNKLSAVNPKEPTDVVRVINGYKNYLRVSIEMHKQSKEEWLTVSELTTSKEHIDSYKDSIKRGVNVRILANEVEATKIKKEMWAPLKKHIRFTEYAPTKFNVVDNNSVTIFMPGDKDFVAIHIKNKGLASKVKGHYERLWAEGKEFK
jgi:HTH-type transcriptional regulator, sugar sensing transcriptional regulator